MPPTSPEIDAMDADGLNMVRRQLAATTPRQYVRAKQMLALIEAQAARIAELEAAAAEWTTFPVLPTKASDL